MRPRWHRRARCGNCGKWIDIDPYGPGWVHTYTDTFWCFPSKPDNSIASPEVA